MAITARFDADFSSFQSAVANAEVSLRAFDVGASTVEKSLARMVDNFSGRKVVQDATLMAEAVDRVGGSAKLTEDELIRVGAKASEAAAKLTAMGVEVPPKIQSLATEFRNTQNAVEGTKSWVDRLGESFVAHVAEGILLRDVIREIVSISKQAFTDASRFEELSRATGITADALQRLSYVGAEFGVGTEEMGRAVEQLSARLAGRDPSATRAVDMLGLSIKKLLADGPIESFLDIAEATGRVQDPMMRGALASDEFGAKLAKILLPALTDLRKKMEDVPKEAIISDENIKSTHDFDVGLQHLETQLKATTVALMGWIKETAKMADDPLLQESLTIAAGNQPPAAAAKPLPIIAPVASHGGALPTAETQTTITNEQLIENALTRLRQDALEPLTASQRKNIEELAKWGQSETEIASLVKASTSAVHLYIQSQRDLAKAIAERDAIETAMYEKRIRGLEAQTQANLKAYSFEGQIENLQKLDAAERELAKSVFETLNSEKDRARIVEGYNLRHLEIQNQINALERQHAERVNAAQAAEVDARHQLEAAMGRNIDGTIHEQSALEKLGTAIDELRNKKVAGISQYEQETLLIKGYTDAELKRALAEDAEIQRLAKKTEAQEKANQSTAAAIALTKQLTTSFATDQLGPLEGGTRGAPGSQQAFFDAAVKGVSFQNAAPSAPRLFNGDTAGGRGNVSIGDVHVHGNIDSEGTARQVVDDIVSRVFQQLQLHSPIQR